MAKDELFEISKELNNELTTVDKYEFEPIQGYPMLNWKGKRPFRSTQYYPAQLKEVYGEEIDGWRNKIYWGDNLQVMSHLLKEYREKIKMIYIDPPFDSKAVYKKKIKLKGKTVENNHNAFEEKQYTDIWTNDEYLQFMYERLILMRELLSGDGLISLQCDWRKAHHLRCILDEVFGNSNFKGEALIRAGTKNVQSQFETVSSLTIGHNSIFIYSKSSDTRVRKLLKDLGHKEPGKWDTFWRGTDRPTLRYELLGVIPEDGQWRWESGRSQESIENYNRYLSEFSCKMELDDYYEYMLTDQDVDLDFVRKNDDGVIQYYVPPRSHQILSNVWFDLSYRGTQTHYPTEKHEDILLRLIEWLTNPGDLVYDCFMGSGTTQAVAMRLGRRFVGADINLGAIQTTTKRLLSVVEEIKDRNSQVDIDIDAHSADGAEIITKFYTGFEVYNVNHYDIFRNPVEAKELLLEALEIQPFQRSEIYDGEKDGRMVKIMPINRIATKADLNDLITGFDYRAFDKRQQDSPNQPVEKLSLVCMGHEPDIAASLQQQVPYKLDIEVVDILRDKSNLEFKRDSEAKIVITDSQIVIERFYPMNLLQKLSLMQEDVDNWRELVESVMIDWNYDGAVLNPAVVDIPPDNDLVTGTYAIPEDAGNIRVKITDLLSESLEVEVQNG